MLGEFVPLQSALKGAFDKRRDRVTKTVVTLAAAKFLPDVIENDCRLTHEMRTFDIGGIPMLAVVNMPGTLLHVGIWAETITMRSADMKNQNVAGIQLLGTTLAIASFQALTSLT